MKFSRTVLAGRDQSPVTGSNGAIVIVVEIEQIAGNRSGLDEGWSETAAREFGANASFRLRARKIHKSREGTTT